MHVSRLIRYPIDLISVALVVFTLTLQVSALVLHWPWYVAIVVLLLLREVGLVEHNHVHLAIFRSRFLNALLGWMCHLSDGVPLETYRIHHVASHHRYNNRFDANGRDWSSIYGFQGTRLPERPVNKAYYVAAFPWLAHGESLIWYLRAPRSRPTRGFITSMLIVGPASALLAWLNPVGFITFFLVPWTIAIFGMGFNNYEQHYACKMTNEYDSSNNFINFFQTVLSFNAGYHVAHHHSPQLHWSLLRRQHELLYPSRMDEEAQPHPAVSSSGG